MTVSQRKGMEPFESISLSKNLYSSLIKELLTLCWPCLTDFTHLLEHDARLKSIAFV